MSKVDFGRINAENEDFFSRKTQKNEGAKKGDEFLFDDEFDNKHVSNNGRAGGDIFDHGHSVDHGHHFNPKEDMTTKNNVDDNTITLISDSDEDTTTEETTTDSTTSSTTSSSTRTVLSLPSELAELASSTTSSTTTDDTTTEETTTDSTTSSTTSSSTRPVATIFGTTSIITTDDGTTIQTAECNVNSHASSYTVTRDSDGNVEEIEFYMSYMADSDDNIYYIKVTVSGDGETLTATIVQKNSDGSYSETTGLDDVTEMSDSTLNRYASSVCSILDYLKTMGILDEDARQNALNTITSWYPEGTFGTVDFSME